MEIAFENIKRVYFIGIGGIGMSALARYFKSIGKEVMGYDKTRTTLTDQLSAEGIAVHYQDLGRAAIDAKTEETLYVYTPAVPADFGELMALRLRGAMIHKRAEVLGMISLGYDTFAIAGTHGKTTTSAILAHILTQTPGGCNAFIGGITSNYNSNFLINPDSKRLVVEADEFDRSFLKLRPKYTAVTSVDADHLDIYGNPAEFRNSFIAFMNQTSPKGILAINAGVKVQPGEITQGSKIITYGFSQKADWEGVNCRYVDERFYFDVPARGFSGVELGIPGNHNAENALAAMALSIESGEDPELVREAIRTFRGVRRRFDVRLKTRDLVIIDDYAHHPTEINALLRSIKMLYPWRKITIVFQPHLFSRTRDFMQGFAESLSLADEVFLLDIYPAREKPIPGITSQVLLDRITSKTKRMSDPNSLVTDLKSEKRELILIVGAGDIDLCVDPVTKAYNQ